MVTLCSRCLVPQLPPSCPAVAPYGSSPVSGYGYAHASLTVPAGDEQTPGPEDQSGETERDASDPFNTYLVRTYSSGKQAYARSSRASGLAAKSVASDRSVVLSPDEAAWMWWIWPAESPERPDTRRARIGFLLATEDERAALIEEAKAEYDAEEAADREKEAAAEEQRRAEEQQRPEKAEKDRADRERQRAAKRAQDEETIRLWAEYADRFHDGSINRAKRHAYGETDGRPGSMQQYMREALGRAAA